VALALSLWLWLDLWYWDAAGSTLAAIVAGLVTGMVLRSLARSQIREAYEPLGQALVRAQILRERCEAHASAGHKKALARHRKQHNHDVLKAQRKYRRARGKIKRRREEEISQSHERFEGLKTASETQRERDSTQIEAKYQRLKAEVQDRYETDSRIVHERRDGILIESKARRERERTEMLTRWTEGLARARVEVAANQAESAKR